MLETSVQHEALWSRRDVERLQRGEHDDPYRVLGMHEAEHGQVLVRCFMPGAERIDVLERATGRVRGMLQQTDVKGFFAGILQAAGGRFAYRLRIHDTDGIRDVDDAYAFPPWLGEQDRRELAQGTHWHAYQVLGAHPCSMDGVQGVAFAVWAPNARRVSVVGPFNQWDGRMHVMRRHLECGAWDIFVPGIGSGELYKFEVLTCGGQLVLKSDPYAFATETPPATASRVANEAPFAWSDAEWMAQRAAANTWSSPMAIYEVHLGSWRRHPDGSMLSYDELADSLIPYVAGMGFTHVELLPVNEHPFGGSWGYQSTALFAPSARWGEPDAFRRFVDRCHAANLGVLLDWVPAHFPRDAHGLERFDGTCLYEHQDPRLGHQQTWNTLVYNFGRREVANFLIANALYWLCECHVDGLRADAVASMLYLDYDREPGRWLPNVFGGNENLEAVAFLRRLNEVVHGIAPAGALMVAEESTAWPMVTRPTYVGGLGFDYKWTMGWMNDTLAYMHHDPIHRRYHQDQLTFGLLYAFSENFILPLSHDEVVYGKRSLFGKMPGDHWQRLANLRVYLSFQYTQPGKKLLFMGGEFAQEREWNHDTSLDWYLLGQAGHAGVQHMVRDLNQLYRWLGSLHRYDCDGNGFSWIDCSDSEQSVLAWYRIGNDGDDTVIVVCNFTPVPRLDYRIGVPKPGVYREIFNSDAREYGGSGMGNAGAVASEEKPAHGQAWSLPLTLPPLAAVMLVVPR